MSDLISRKALLEDLSKWLEPDFNELVSGVFKQITNAPAVETVTLPNGWVALPIEPTDEIILEIRNLVDKNNKYFLHKDLGAALIYKKVIQQAISFCE